MSEQEKYLRDRVGVLRKKTKCKGYGDFFPFPEGIDAKTPPNKRDELYQRMILDLNKALRDFGKPDDSVFHPRFWQLLNTALSSSEPNAPDSFRLYLENAYNDLREAQLDLVQREVRKRLRGNGEYDDFFVEVRQQALDYLRQNIGRSEHCIAERNILEIPGLTNAGQVGVCDMNKAETHEIIEYPYRLMGLAQDALPMEIAKARIDRKKGWYCRTSGTDSTRLLGNEDIELLFALLSYEFERKLEKVIGQTIC